MNLFLIFQYGLVGLLVVLVTLFSSVMFCETCTEWVGQRLGLYTKNQILKFLGIGMGGVLLALQALMSYKRAKALEDTAKAQAEAAKAMRDSVPLAPSARWMSDHVRHDANAARL